MEGTEMFKRSTQVLLGALVTSALASTAMAGPVEQLEAVSIDPMDASHLVVPHRYGGGGMLVSRDGGETFGWLCSAGVAPSAVNRNGRTFVGGDGAIYVGLFDGLLKGGADGCGFAPVPELDKKYVSDFSTDPIDPKRTYLVTTNAMADNYIYLDDGSGKFVQLGTPVANFIDTLDVVKNGEGRRFYETGVKTDVATNNVQYGVRVSDDEGMTWTDEPFDIAPFQPMDKYAEFSIVAIHPSNPDLVVGRIWRKQAVDTLLYSMEKGKAGTWQVVAEPNEAEAVTFTETGALYFGDSDQKTKGVFVVEKLGDAPKLLTDSWRPLCLGYDQANKRLLGCGNFYLFGTVDMQSGELTPLLDLRCMERFVECPGQQATSAVCEPQAQADFCHLSHWVLAPMCNVYDRGPELATYQASQTFMCVDGFGVPKAESAAPAANAAGSGAAGTPASSPAGACAAGACAPPTTGEPSSGSAGAKATSAPAKTSSTGCSVSGAPSARGSASLLALTLLTAAGIFRRRTRAR
jgi:hypothetical protein